jgi:hypothetical protein
VALNTLYWGSPEIASQGARVFTAADPLIKRAICNHFYFKTLSLFPPLRRPHNQPQAMSLIDLITSMDPVYILLCAVASSGVLLAYFASSTPSVLARRANARLPPGPPRLPLLGSLLKYPKNRWFETFSDLQKQYGESYGCLCACLHMTGKDR